MSKNYFQLSSFSQTKLPTIRNKLAKFEKKKSTRLHSASFHSTYKLLSKAQHVKVDLNLPSHNQEESQVFLT